MSWNKIQEAEEILRGVWLILYSETVPITQSFKIQSWKSDWSF